MGTARVSDSLARPIPADPSAGDRVLPADTWPVRWARHDGLELGVRVAAMRVAAMRGAGRAQQRRCRPCGWRRARPRQSQRASARRARRAGAAAGVGAGWGVSPLTGAGPASLRQGPSPRRGSTGRQAPVRGRRVPARPHDQADQGRRSGWPGPGQGMASAWTQPPAECHQAWSRLRWTASIMNLSAWPPSATPCMQRLMSRLIGSRPSRLMALCCACDLRLCFAALQLAFISLSPENHRRGVASPPFPALATIVDHARTDVTIGEVWVG
jgi:hypothetical protein